MTMTHKERLRRALLHEPLDRFPTQINYTGRMGAKLAAHFEVHLTDLPAFLDNHLMRVDIDYQEPIDLTGQVKFDSWGAGHAMGEEGYFIAVSPLADSKALDAYPWPDLAAPGLLDRAIETIRESGGEYFIIPNIGWALFERAWSLRGLENFLMDLAAETGFVNELLDRITVIQLALIERFINAGVDGAYFGDDYGAQKSLIISPKMWRTFIKPRLARLFEPFRRRGLPILMHSDGQIQQILPDLLEIGLTTLNPVQPEVLNHEWLRDYFGGKLSFYGGVSTQTVLPKGRPKQVKTAVENCRKVLAYEKTGLIVAPSHRLMTDIPMKNIEALLDALKVQAGI